MANKAKIIKGFKRIKSLGFIKSKRPNDTGIDKTFEDYLGVKENNLKDPDFEGYEVKSHRRTSISFVTLFTKSPTDPHGANAILRETFGRPEGKYKVKTIRTSVFSDRWNTYNGKFQFRISINKQKSAVDLLSKEIDKSKISVACSWSFKELEKSFDKLKSLFYVTAEREKKRRYEYFHYTHATIFNKPSFQNLIKLIDSGKIMVDLRLGVYSSGPNKGRAHDHGTGFRIKSNDLQSLYTDIIDVN